MKTFTEDTIASFQRGIEKLNGRREPHEVSGPASEEELLRIEAAMKTPLPRGLREFASTVSRRIFFSWELPEEIELPDNLKEVFGGGLDYDISRIPDHELSRSHWQRECFSNAEDPYDVVWHNKIGFHDVSNGDCLGLDPEGKVTYLSHADGEGHGCLMATSVTDLIRQWLPLGCPGPEDWQWLPFVSSNKPGIALDCDAAKQWLSLIHNKL